MKKHCKRFFGKQLLLCLSALVLAACPLVTETDGGGGETETVSIPETVSLTGGSFTMGDDSAFSSDEKPEHIVQISSFSMGKYEVTYDQFIDFLNGKGVSADGTYGGNILIDMSASHCAVVYNGSRFTFSADDYSLTSDCPVAFVTWNGAVEYCSWLSDETGDTYRLPTEAEWEFAARGGTADEDYDYSGSATMDGIGWYFSNSSNRSHRVGTKTANTLGLYDMCGNVIEWCSDYYDGSYYSVSPDTDPTGPSSGSQRALRGGAWNNSSEFCRLAYRYIDSPDTADAHYGFRVVKE